MAIEENGGGLNVSMPVQPMYGGGYGYPMVGGGFGNGFGGYGGDWAWILLLLLIGGGGWGGFGGGWGGMMGGMGLGIDFPWILNGQNGINNNVNDGFRTSQLSDAVTSVRDGISSLSTQMCGGFGDIQTALCGGFAGVNQNVSNVGASIQNSLCQGFAGTTAAVTGAQNALAQQMYANQLADLNRSFDAQTANTAGLNAVQGQLAQCCCDNRAGLESLRYTVATENCNDRAALSDGIRDLLAATQAQTQTILTQLCNDKIEAKNDTIAQLRSELLYARGQASQDVQTAAIRAGQATTANQLVSELRSCPIPAMPVYGNQAIFTCNQNGCGCNGGGIVA